ncbi:hypothetical protein [Acrocarpospora sp. B8E8]
MRGSAPGADGTEWGGGRGDGTAPPAHDGDGDGAVVLGIVVSVLRNV